jgi:endonuclease YncB( thermonuclease family)
LASVIVDEININQQMIDNHMAVKYKGQSKQDIKLEHMNNRTKLIELGVYKPDGQGAATT